MEPALSPASLWMMAAGVMVVLEMVGLSGIGLLFAGLAALSVGMAIQFHWLGDASYIWQWGWFLLLTAIWATVLWKPFMRLSRKSPGATYHNMIGHKAKAVAELLPGQEGTVRWSGTTMRATLQGEEPVAAGEEVEIVAVEGNMLTVKKK